MRNRWSNHSLPPLSFLVLLGLFMSLAGPVQRATACNVGVTSVVASRNLQVANENGSRGEVRFKIMSIGCPSGDSNTVMVGAAPLEEATSLRVTGWTANPIAVAIPASGTSSREQTLEFEVAGGDGRVRFQVSIVACNGKSCRELDWERFPNHVPTDFLILP